MAYITTFLSLILALGSAPCYNTMSLRSLNGLPIRQDIEGGKKTTIDKVPYLVAYMNYNFENYDSQLGGAGAIVSNSWTVTTHEVTQYINPSSSYVVAGSNSLETGHIYGIDRILVHPQFDGHLDYDYALVQIYGKFKWSAQVKPVKLPKRDLRTKTTMTVAGWGATQPGSTVSGQLKQGTMTWPSRKSCIKTLRDSEIKVTPRTACAYYNGDATLCYGDEGDPFISNGVFYGNFLDSIDGSGCSQGPLILNDIAAVAKWVKYHTGAKYEDEEFEEDEE